MSTLKSENNYKAGFVALVGQPNAGKSTLMNRLVKEKLSIVTAKPQTTRRRVIGIVNADQGPQQGQVVFVDSPGFIKANKGLNSFLAKEVLDVFESSDCLIAVLSVDEKEPKGIQQILDLIKESGKKWIAVINKVDKVDLHSRVTKIREMIEKTKVGTPVFEFSSTWKQDADPVIQQIVQAALVHLPDCPEPLYDVELFTPHTTRELAAEIIREACFEELTQEVPYSIAVRISKFDEDSSKMTKIYGDVLVSRESHKPIVIGKGAQVIKKIGTRARKEIEKMLGKKVFLSLEVTCREDWFNNKRMMKELGYALDERNG